MPANSQQARFRFHRRNSFSVVTALLFILTCGYGAAQPPARQALNSDASLAVTTGKVSTTRFTRFLNISGSINAWQEVVISPEVGGYRVEEVLVDVGDFVSQGQELARLSSTLLETDLASKKAMLKQREAELINAGLVQDRAESMAEKNLLSTADLDRLNSEELAAQARLEAARADLDAAEARLRFARITAPDAGVVSSRSISVGQIAQAGGEMMRLLRQNRMEWRGEVPESSMPSLHVGQNVTVTSADGQEHAGSIRIVSPTVNPNTHNGLVYVDVESNDALRPGMFARGKIEISQEEAIVVPLNSLISNDGYYYVFVVGTDYKVRRQQIQTGVIQGENIEVLSGLSEGTSIVTNGAGFLKDGDLVNVIEEF